MQVVIIIQYESLKTSELKLIGRGKHGSVYMIDSQRCIKIFKKRHACSDELNTLLMGQIDMHFPRLYAAGENYIIREYIEGIELDVYLSCHKLTPNISLKIIELYEAMKKVGFNRLDAALFHILVTPSENLMIIDTANSMKKKASRPDLILSGLRELQCDEYFLNHVKNIRPGLYAKWKKYSRRKYQKYR